jgi:ribonuclease HII
MFIAGVDEAGRGPVIGPMVMAIVACKDETVLKKKGMKDSKLLTPEQRESLAHVLRNDEDVKYEIISLSPSDIDAAVQGSEDNLNKLEARTTALLIYRLAKRIPLQSVTVDSPTRTVASYERLVREALDKLDREGTTKNILLRAEIKADYNHPVVGAASILAKTTRDEAMKVLNESHGKMGSGYPSDPDTQIYLQEHWREAHDFFRKSWESYQRLAESRSQSSLVDFGAQDGKHLKILKAFEILKEHGFDLVPPANQYEVVRMRRDGATVIAYTTEKVLVQGPEREKKHAEELLTTLGLMPTEKKRGRPAKS